MEGKLSEEHRNLIVYTAVIAFCFFILGTFIGIYMSSTSCSIIRVVYDSMSEELYVCQVELADNKLATASCEDNLDRTEGFLGEWIIDCMRLRKDCKPNRAITGGPHDRRDMCPSGYSNGCILFDEPPSCTYGFYYEGPDGALFVWNLTEEGWRQIKSWGYARADFTRFCMNNDYLGRA